MEKRFLFNFLFPSIRKTILYTRYKFKFHSTRSIKVAWLKVSAIIFKLIVGGRPL